MNKSLLIRPNILLLLIYINVEKKPTTDHTLKKRYLLQNEL